MPVLDANDPLPRRPRRIVVAGSSGAGKTTLAARIAALLGVPRVELDGLFHGPGWTTRESFAADVDAFSARPSWVTEWQYPAARAVLAERADLLVWLDFSRATVMRRVVRRTVRRRLRRQVLWNGNIEAALWTVLTDPEHVVRLAWSTWPDTAARVTGLRRQHPELVIVRLADPRAARHWLSGPLRRAGDLPTDWHSR